MKLKRYVMDCLQPNGEWIEVIAEYFESRRVAVREMVGLVSGLVDGRWRVLQRDRPKSW